jgi:hypothetical protein
VKHSTINICGAELTFNTFYVNGAGRMIAILSGLRYNQYQLPLDATADEWRAIERQVAIWER